jgi:cobalt/nickel transport system ATP-binding protein
MAVDGNLIRCENISFAYPGGERVFEGLDFRLDEGERVGILGPNGSGKSTLFYIIVGLLRPEAGTVTVDGEILVRPDDFRRAREKVGLLFQDADDQLFSPTVAEDVAFGPRNLGQSEETAQATVEETLGKLGIEGLARRVTHRLSGGEKRLVALATVLAMRPRVLLLDEPVAGLDSETTDRIADLLPRLGACCAVISHDQAFLERTTPRILRMEGGRISESGA